MQTIIFLSFFGRVVGSSQFFENGENEMIGGGETTNSVKL